MNLEKANIIYLSLGTNLGNRKDNLERCIKLIRNKIGSIVNQSGIYQSEPWGFESDHAFYNMCLGVETNLSPDVVMVKILDIEEEIGRMRNREGYTDRLIDIDLLFYNELVTESRNLTIPHPRIGERRFVLEPLNEICPDFIHPVLLKSIFELLRDCQDEGVVEPI